MRFFEQVPSLFSINFLLTLALIFQGVVNGPTTINGPTMMQTGLGGGTPVVTGAALSNGSASSLTTNFTAPAGTFGIRVAIHIASGGITSIKDCAGSGCGGATTDTFAVALACTTLGGASLCEYYICQSALAAGASSVTVVIPAALSFFVEVDPITGMSVSGCLHQTGTATATSTNPSVSTSANVDVSNELVLASVGAGVVPGAGAGFTQTVTSGGYKGESSNSAPSVGSPATATYTATSSQWRAMVSTWK